MTRPTNASLGLPVRDKRIFVPVTADEKDKIEEKAREAKKPVAEFVRDRSLR